MKILIVTGLLVPQCGNNANLIGKMIPYLKKKNHEVQIFSMAYHYDEKDLPTEYFGCPVYFETFNDHGFKEKVLFPGIARGIYRDKLSDAVFSYTMESKINKIREVFPFDAVISTMEPYYAAYASCAAKGTKRVLYIMDPPQGLVGEGTPFRNRTLKKILKNQDSVITTPFIHQALNENGYRSVLKKVYEVGFPLIKKHDPPCKKATSEQIHLLFCGWLYPEIRSPKKFIEVINQLDERFHITFMGKECEKLPELYEINTKATVECLPRQEYSVALQAMEDADILVNIGNSVPVHMPSKTLEYINTGKPIINFYKFEECPTLYYTKRYPFCLNIFEKEDAKEAGKKVEEFCLENKNRIVDSEKVCELYQDCTEAYISQQILTSLE